MRIPATQPPRFESIALAALAEGDASSLDRGAQLEGVSFSGVQLETLDLRGGLLDGVHFAGVRAGRAELGGAVLREVVIDGADLPLVQAARAGCTDVRVTGRLGAVDLTDASLRAVRFDHCKLGFVNLRGAELLDVAFDDCTVEELDLGGARVRRARFTGTRIGELALHHAKLSDVDLRGTDLERIGGLEYLRGATVDSGQLALLAPALAAHFGVRVEG